MARLPKKTRKKAKNNSVTDRKDLTITYWKRFGFYEKRQRNVAKRHLMDASRRRPTPTIHVAYRDDGKVRGTGAHFDHRTLQLISGVPTVVANLTEGQAHLNEYLQNHAELQLPHADAGAGAVPAPPVETELSALEGLLFLPGVPRNVKESSQQLEPRSEQNTALIQDAINRGKPILAVCGGSWALWQHFDGELVAVKDHCSSRMPSLNSLGKVGYNMQIHRIALQEAGLILKASMAYEQNRVANPYPTVNSVHWLAPGGETPDVFDISARSRQDQILAPMGRHQAQMQPEANVIECFESRFGAPMLGVQWHPEAYTSNTKAQFYPAQQQGIIQYMVKASQTYQLKQQLNEEFMGLAQSVATFLKKVSIKTESPIGDLVMDSAYPGASAAPRKPRFWWQDEYCADQARRAQLPAENDSVKVVHEVIEGVLRDVVVL